NLQHFSLDVPSRHSSWTTMAPPTLAALRNMEFEGKYSHIDSIPFRNSPRISGVASSKNSPDGFGSFEMTRLRYRNSDISLVNLNLDVDANGRDMGIWNMEPPAD